MVAGQLYMEIVLAGLRPLSLDPELRYRYRSAELYDAGDTVLQGAFSRSTRPHQRSLEVARGLCMAL